MEDFFNSYLNSSTPKLNMNHLNGFIGKPYEESKYLIRKYLDTNKLNNYIIVDYVDKKQNMNHIVIQHENNIVKKITIN
jgi:hypothetical protein